jgi:hypothetical protein
MQILGVIRCFVDGLRSAPNLNVRLESTMTKDDKVASGSLLTHLISIGVIQQAQELLTLLGKACPSETPMLNHLGVSFGSLLRQHYDADERKQILYHLIFPLLCHLEKCYCILDMADVPQAHSAEKYSTIQTQTPATENKRKVPATPPIGMLSLNDYTNVACLLEFTISICLIPLLEHPDVYLPPLTKISDQYLSTDTHIHEIDIQATFIALKRNQALPKSLAGRISKTALTWGTVYAANNHNALNKRLLMFRTQLLNLTQNDSKDKHALLQLHHIYRILSAYNEMTMVATTVGRLLLLDRFRPMLLSRHLSDIYLSLLVAERLKWHLSKVDNHARFTDDVILAKLIETEMTVEIWNSERLHALYKSLFMFPLVLQSPLISEPPKKIQPERKIDCREAAVGYRSLLSGGASMNVSGASNTIPEWLRLRLGQCLSKLAQEDLQSVVEVFVANAFGPGGGDDMNANVNDDVMTGASARLAYALCAKPRTALNSSLSNRKFLAFKEHLCTQFVDFLVLEGESYVVGLKSNACSDPSQSRSSNAMHLTLWATFAQLPIETLHSFFIIRLISGLVPHEEADSHERNSPQLTAMQSMAAIVKWLCRIPSILDVRLKKTVQALLLKSCMPNSCDHLTIVGQTLRLASSFSHDNLVVEVIGKVVDDDKVLAELAQKAFVKMVDILGELSTSRHDQMTTVALELLMTVSTNRFDKEGFCFGNAELDSPCFAFRKKIGASKEIDLSHSIGGVERRIMCLVGAMSAISESNDKRCNMDEFSSTVFRVALLLHYSSTAEGDYNDIIDDLGLDEILKSGGYELRMTASIALGTMSEKIPPSSLLGSGNFDIESNTSILSILGLIINAAATHMKDVEEIRAQTTLSTEIFSTVSLVLNILITLLELGAEKRSLSDETFFKSILPSLEVIASGKCEGRSSQILMMPELAEMASHAMALIVARGENATTNDFQSPLVFNKKTRIESILTKLSQAECDLRSSHPPLRARGVVSLRHLAHSLVSNDQGCIDMHLSNTANNRKALITQIDEPLGVPTKMLSSNDELSLISRTLAKICLDALADPESYVYLASIQTLVTVSDVRPYDIVSLMSEAVTRGQLNISVANVKADVAFVELLLTSEQRIKAIEALIFIIRRRGDGIFIYGSLLLDTMLFGSRNDEDSRDFTLGCDGQTAHLIQRQTHSFFMGAATDAVDDEDVEEKKIRLSTGGPIFSMEETDVLRAGAISVVCELISMLNPITVASYCHILVRLSTDALQLDASRPIRRIAACLARDLYTCVRREATSLTGGNEDCTSSMTMAVAIVDAGEENLYSVLTRCVSADELAATSRPNFVDIATQSRSQEAIDIRLDLEAMGVLHAATVIVHALNMELNNPVIQGVRKAISRRSA